MKLRYPPFTDRDLETYLAGAAEPELTLRIEAAEDQDEALRDYLAARRAEDDAFRILHPVLPQRSMTRSQRWFPIGLAAAAMAASLMFWVSPETPTGPDVRMRGAFTSSLLVHRDGRVFEWEEGVPLRKSDRVRIGVQSVSGGYLNVVAKTGAKQFEIYYDRIKVSPGEFIVANALLLDDHLGQEDWYLVLTDDPVEASVLSATLRRGESAQGNVVVLPISKGPVR